MWRVNKTCNINWMIILTVAPTHLRLRHLWHLRKHILLIIHVIIVGVDRRSVSVKMLESRWINILNIKIGGPIVFQWWWWWRWRWWSIGETVISIVYITATIINIITVVIINAKTLLLIVVNTIILAVCHTDIW